MRIRCEAGAGLAGVAFPSDCRTFPVRVETPFWTVGSGTLTCAEVDAVAQAATAATVAPPASSFVSFMLPLPFINGLCAGSRLPGNIPRAQSTQNWPHPRRLGHYGAPH